MMFASNMTYPDAVSLIAFFALISFIVWCLTKDGGKE